MADPRSATPSPTTPRRRASVLGARVPPADRDVQGDRCEADPQRRGGGRGHPVMRCWVTGDRGGLAGQQGRVSACGCAKATSRVHRVHAFAVRRGPAADLSPTSPGWVPVVVRIKEQHAVQSGDCQVGNISTDLLYKLLRSGGWSRAGWASTGAMAWRAQPSWVWKPPEGWTLLAQPDKPDLVISRQYCLRAPGRGAVRRAGIRLT